MEPWQSWGIVGIVGVGVYWYYTNQYGSKRGRGRATVPSQQGQRRDSMLRDENKGRRKRENTSGTLSHGASDAADISSASVANSGNDRLKKRKGGKNQPSQPVQSSAVEVSKEIPVDVDSGKGKESDMDNKDFAQQLASLKTGTALNRPASTNETKKTKKQGKRNEMAPEPFNDSSSKSSGLLGVQDMSTASSTTGADADDDLSPAMSPVFGATQSIAPTGGVSDMLEAPSKGPSVLRLTQPSTPQPIKQSKPQKQTPEPETKKQRQNRQKNEEKKIAREQAEMERRVSLEKQLRTAREAEGRPSKNGLASSRLPSTNAWTKPATGSMPMAAAAATNTGPLLDTFDEPTPAATTGDQRQANGTVEEKMWDRDLPSEEDQMRMLSELNNDGWNTVEKNAKGKKKATVKPEEPEKVLPVNGQKRTETHYNKPHDKTKIASANENGSGKRESAASNNIKGPLNSNSTRDEPKKKRASKEDIDPNVWNRSNIHNHPDYDPELPYALTGHPDDDDWAVV